MQRFLLKNIKFVLIIKYVKMRVGLFSPKRMIPAELLWADGFAFNVGCVVII